MLALAVGLSSCAMPFAPLNPLDGGGGGNPTRKTIPANEQPTPYTPLAQDGALHQREGWSGHEG